MLAYRFLTDDDSAAFYHKVTAALAAGWQLYGGPSYAADPGSGRMRRGQAVVKEVDRSYDPDMKLGDL
jgi:hypothetical protein